MPDGHQLIGIRGTAATMRIPLVSVISVLSIGAGLLGVVSHPLQASQARTPVLVELFTSEGCSSCPPADRLLQKLDGQPIAGAEIIVLSEHVDYWNQIGWKDPYSARSYSERQSAYARRFGLDDVYTPQMVVDGTSEFTGSDSGLADKAIAKALGAPKIPVHVSSLLVDASNNLHAHIETGTLAATFGSPQAEVYVAIALNHAESQVSAGENAGHKLTHVSVVRSLAEIGVLNQGQALTKDLQLKLESGSDAHNLRLIAFIQEPRRGRVLGAVEQPVDTK
jgi:hypothetical protein